MKSTTNAIGEILLENGNPLLKMWEVNISCGERRYVKHSHTRFEITVVNGGEGEYTTENAVYKMKKGDVFVFSSNEQHCITKVSRGGITITNLHFEPRYLIENHKSDDFVNFCFSHSHNFSNRIPYADAEILRKNHTMIKKELSSREESYTAAIRAYLDIILIDLLRNHKYVEHIKTANQNNIFNMLSVFGYIEEHLEENLSLCRLASVAGLSPNYFSHIFKQLNGISLWDYITAKRIEKAVKLIMSGGSLTMLETAMLCGFNNTVNFNKAFKKQKGITPSELKKNPKLLSH